MAWVVPRTAITPDLEKVITTHLWLTPKTGYSESTESFRAYIADSTNVYLPFFFGKRLFPGIPQPWMTATYLPGISPWTFKGQLRIRREINQITTVTTLLQQLYTNGSSSLNAFCGAGKTVMGMAAAAWINGITTSQGKRAPIIICYTLEILENQWINTVTQHTNATYYAVRDAKGTPERVPLDVDIYLCMISMLQVLPEVIRNTCQMLMLDEAHMFCTDNRLQNLLLVRPRMVLPITATPYRPDGLETILFMLAGQHAVKVVATVPFTIWRYDTGFRPPLMFNKQGKPDWTQIVNWLTIQEQRDSMILEWVRLNPTKKIAILTTRTDHARKLYQKLLACGESASVFVGDSEDYPKCRVLVLGIKKGGVGFDEANLCKGFTDEDGRINMLILSISVRAVFEQAIGRAFRSSNPHVIFFVDTSKIIENHWKQAEDWCTDPARDERVKIEYTDKPVQLPE
jgi:hypothetical protein